MGLEDLKLNFFETTYTPETSTNNGGGTNIDDYAKKLISIFDANRSGTTQIMWQLYMQEVKVMLHLNLPMVQKTL